MEKIFEIREYTDGGTFDKGDVTGYIKTDKTRDEMRKENGHGFTDYLEITQEEYLKKKKLAEEFLAMFSIDIETKNTGKVRNGSVVKILDRGSSDSVVGEIGTVNCYEDGSIFRVHVEGRENLVNWHSLKQVEVLEY